MEYLIRTEKTFPRCINTTLGNKIKLPFGDRIKNIRVV